MATKPFIVRSAPAACPYAISVPLHRITRAVSVHITIVSINTSNIPQSPCCTGCFTSEHAWAIDPVPRPASLEKIPLDTPFRMLRNRLPTTPPVTDFGLNAPSNIDANTSGTLLIFIKTRIIAMIIYIAAINGTSFSATLPIRFIPPISISATRMAIMIPITRFIVNALLLSARL